jgi:hypothetical protein
MSGWVDPRIVTFTAVGQQVSEYNSRRRSSGRRRRARWRTVTGSDGKGSTTQSTVVLLYPQFSCEPEVTTATSRMRQQP